MERADYERVYEFLNYLKIEFEGKQIYFGTTKEFCQQHQIDESEYYEYFSQDIIKLPRMRT